MFSENRDGAGFRPSRIVNLAWFMKPISLSGFLQLVDGLMKLPDPAGRQFPEEIRVGLSKAINTNLQNAMTKYGLPCCAETMGKLIELLDSGKLEVQRWNEL